MPRRGLDPQPSMTHFPVREFTTALPLGSIEDLDCTSAMFKMPLNWAFMSNQNLNVKSMRAQVLWWTEVERKEKPQLMERN